MSGSAKSPHSILIERLTNSSSELKEWIENVNCKIGEHLQNFTVLKNKNSYSASIIMFGDVTHKGKNIPITIKLVFDAKDKLNNSLKIEQQIYENVTEKLILNYNTPHLMKCLGVVKSCGVEDIMNSFKNKEELTIFKDCRKTINKKVYDVNDVSMLILEKCQGKTLHYYSQHENLNEAEVLNILFQLLYTLKCFEQIKLTHNDMHMNNIFINKLKEPEERIYYITKDRWVKINVTYDVKIFDYDRGSIYHPSVDRNFMLDIKFCETYNECSSYDPKRDLQSVISTVYQYFRNSRRFIKNCTSIGFLSKTYDREYMHLNAYDNNDGYGIRAGSPIKDEDLFSISICIEKLLEYEEFVCEKGTGKNNGIIYNLPPINEIQYWNPTSTISHKSLDCPMSKKSTNIVDDDCIENLQQNLKKFINIDNLYSREFGKQSMLENTIILFKKFISIKNVSEDFHILYYLCCYLLCFPFFYKFNNEDILNFADQKRFLKNKDISTHIPKFIDDIWNVFNGTLPITIIKI